MDDSRADHAGWREKDSIEIPGDYQYLALTEGFAVQRFWHARKLDLVRRVAPPVPGGLALDVGCGSGVLANFLAEQGATVDAVDSNEAAIRFATRQFGSDEGGDNAECRMPNAESMPNARCRMPAEERLGCSGHSSFVIRHSSFPPGRHRGSLHFHLAPANELPFPDGTFGRVYCLEVIEHLAAGQGVELLRALGRLLSPDGLLLVTTPNYGGLWPAIERMMDALRLAPRMKGEQHVTRFRLRPLRVAAASAGLEIQRSGRFCGLAPFASVVSWRLAEWLDRAGWRLGHPLGNLLYLVAGKPND